MPNDSNPGTSERRNGLTTFRRAWVGFIILATSLPYLLNWWQTPAGYHYTWILPPYPEDSFGYMAWARQAANGAWLFKIKYTALPHQAFLFHPLFLVCGWLSALSSCQLGVVFWLVKAMGTALFFVVFHRYLDFLGLNARQSIVASVLTGIASGFGVVLYWLGIKAGWALISADLWLPGLSTFWSLMWNPLFPFSLTLLLLSIFLIDRGTRLGSYADMWRAGLVTGAMVLLHPYAAPLVFAFATTVAIARLQAGSVGHLARYAAAALPFALYIALLSHFNPLLQRHSAAGQMKSPALFEVVLGFGLPLVLSLIGLVFIRSVLVRKYWQIALWFFLAVSFAYLPVWFQQKFLFGAQIPLCIIAAIAFDLMLSRYLSKSRQRWACIVAGLMFIPVLAATNAYVVFDENREVTADREGTYMLSDDMMAALNALKTQSKPNEIVLATPATSRLIPGYAGNTVLWGHWAMSVDYQDRQAAIGRLLDVRSQFDDATRTAQFWNSGISIVFADGELKQSISQSPFLWGTILKKAGKIFENESVVIYRRPDKL